MAQSSRPSISQPQHIFFGQENFFCYDCRNLVLDLIPHTGKTYETDTRFSHCFYSTGHVVGKRLKECGYCRLLILAMEALQQKSSQYLIINDALRLSVCKYSATDPISSWIEFYRLSIEENPAIPDTVQIGWHVAKFGTTEFHQSVTRWIQPYVNSTRPPKRVLDLKPTRLVDTHDDDFVRLVELENQAAVYATLSHCWVGRNILRTTKATHAEHRRRIQVQKMSRTFREAIMFCRSLNIQYLWIDSLCIVQDDSADWKTQSALMADIYENASFCIAAHSQRDELFPDPEKWRQAFSLNRNGHCGEVFARLVPPVSFQDRPFRSPLNAGQTLKHNPWLWDHIDLRGWCFQERVLSGAILHFTPQEVMLEANGRVESCQCGFHPYYMYRSTHDPNNRKLKAKWAQCRPDGSGYFFQSSERLHPLDWKFLVELYSTRVLTQASDLLPALAGVAARFESKLHRFKGKYVAGIWDFPMHNCSLEIWLCWYSYGWSDRAWAGCRKCRVYPERGGLYPSSSFEDRVKSEPSFCIPSFSWISRMGPCKWPSDLFEHQWTLSACVSRPMIYRPDPAFPLGRILEAQISIHGPAIDGIFFTSAGVPPSYSGDHRNVFAYFVDSVTSSSELADEILEEQRGDSSPRFTKFRRVQEKAVEFILDAGDDVPIDGSEGTMLEMGRSPKGLAIYLVLVQSPLSGSDIPKIPQYYRRIGLAVTVNATDIAQDTINEMRSENKYISTHTLDSLSYVEKRTLYLI